MWLNLYGCLAVQNQDFFIAKNAFLIFFYMKSEVFFWTA
jgi:hypothetical protein